MKASNALESMIYGRAAFTLFIICAFIISYVVSAIATIIRNTWNKR